MAKKKQRQIYSPRKHLAKHMGVGWGALCGNALTPDAMRLRGLPITDEALVDDPGDVDCEECNEASINAIWRL